MEFVLLMFREAITPHVNATDITGAEPVVASDVDVSVTRPTRSHSFIISSKHTTCIQPHCTALNTADSPPAPIHFAIALQVLYRRGVWDSWLSGKADVQCDSGKQAVGVAGNVRLKVFRLNVTDKQDLQLAAGYDYTLGSIGRSLVSV